MPEFLDKPTCLGVGETGLQIWTRSSLQAHVEMAMKHDQLVLIHTPHLSDKAHGTKTVLEVLAGMDVNPDRIWIDHVEEQAIKPVLDAGYWADELYPVTNAVHDGRLIFTEKYQGAINGEFYPDWGPSDPFTLQESIVEFRRQAHLRDARNLS